MDNNIDFWFYTLSAIPQTLGAVIALTAVFIVFRLDHIERRRQDEEKEVNLWLTLPLFYKDNKAIIVSKLNSEEVLDCLKQGVKKLKRDETNLGVPSLNAGCKYDDLVDLYKQSISSFEQRFKITEDKIYDRILEKKRIWKSLLEGKEEAVQYLKECLCITALPIVVSFILLPLHVSVVSYDTYILSALIGFAGAAVFYTAYCIWTIARRDLR